MINHLLGIVATITFIIVCTLLPLLPGSYDSLAVPLSTMAQVGSVLALTLVPWGLLLIAADRSELLAKRRLVFALLALIAWSLVWGGMCVAAIAQSGLALAVAAFVFWAWSVRRAWAVLRRRKELGSAHAFPFYLVTVPVAVVLIQLVLVDRAVTFSRNRAILGSAPLIQAIEQHRVQNGRYPMSLQSVWPDYKTNVIGISEYRYEPHGAAYNLFFEQFTNRFGTREFVMYNPRDEYVMTSHVYDLLELTPEQLALERMRGHNALNDAPFPHWKYFWFD